MAKFFVNIPCYVTKDAPERALSPDKLLSIEVEADSFVGALARVVDSIQRATASAQVWKP